MAPFPMYWGMWCRTRLFIGKMSTNYSTNTQNPLETFLLPKHIPLDLSVRFWRCFLTEALRPFITAAKAKPVPSVSLPSTKAVLISATEKTRVWLYRKLHNEKSTCACNCKSQWLLSKRHSWTSLPWPLALATHIFRTTSIFNPISMLFNSQISYKTNRIYTHNFCTLLPSDYIFDCMLFFLPIFLWQLFNFFRILPAHFFVWSEASTPEN